MKIIKILLLLLLAQFQTGIAQEVDQISKLDSSTVYGVDNLDVKPFFPGGQKEFEHFLRKNFKTADNEKMPRLNGLRISFIVDRSGNFTNIQGLDEMNPLARARFMMFYKTAITGQPQFEIKPFFEHKLHYLYLYLLIKTKKTSKKVVNHSAERKRKSELNLI